nr:MAG TPA: hypothetical protein [Caudoviricetes sp.]
MNILINIFHKNLLKILTFSPKLEFMLIYLEY